MSLKQTHDEAVQAKANDYQLAMPGVTTGLDSLGSDINAYNDYGMTAVQVALQAGKVDELLEIMRNPACEPQKASKAGYATAFYISLFESTNDSATTEKTAKAMREILKDALTPKTVSALVF